MGKDPDHEVAFAIPQPMKKRDSTAALRSKDLRNKAEPRAARFMKSTNVTEKKQPPAFHPKWPGH